MGVQRVKPDDPLQVANELHVVKQLQRLLQRRFGVRAEVVSGPQLVGARDQLRTPVTLRGKEIGSVTLRPPTDADERDRDLLADLVQVLAQEIGVAAADRLVDADPSAATRYRYDDLIGRSTEMNLLKRTLDKVIDAEAIVLVQGENGTGKELIARAIHYNSPRASEMFVATNCSAFNDNLLDSELFGHKKGAFTGAVSDKPGLFETADRGTFFLDEIGDMSPALQVKVLRVIQEGTYTPVGDTQPRRVDVRIVAATNRDLRRMVDRGEFREDLYYRVNVINLVVPPLRERREDIPLLVQHFLAQAARGRGGKPKRLSTACLDRFMVHAWPGNVRELENEIERLVVLAGDARVMSEQLLSPRIAGRIAAAKLIGEAGSLREARARTESELIRAALARHRWNKTRAAEELGMSRRNLIRKVDRYKLGPSRRAKKRPAAKTT